MNKQGHMATAVCAGAMLLFALPGMSWISSGIVLATAAMGGLAPDIDHKTSTVSQLIQFSSRRRKQFRTASSVVFGIGLLLGAGKLGFFSAMPMIQVLVDSWLLWLGGGLLLWGLARLRTLVLAGVGILLLLGFALLGWHSFTACLGVVFLLLPILPHRGLIHTPEFAVLLSIGSYSLAIGSETWVMPILMGFLTGWWAHLIADCFGAEGIHSQVFPKLKIALRAFSNGGAAERFISALCWSCTAVYMLLGYPWMEVLRWVGFST